MDKFNDFHQMNLVLIYFSLQLTSGTEKIMLKTSLFLFLLPLLTFGAVAPEIDYALMSRYGFYSAAIKGTADAGVALPGDVVYGIRNPALFFSSITDRTTEIACGYGRDPLFDGHIADFAAAYTNGRGALGGAYRYLSAHIPMRQHETTLNLSGILFENTDVKGRVDFGVNFRYEWMNLSGTGHRTMPVERYEVDRWGTTIYKTTIDSIQVQYSREPTARRFIMDIGFYQPDFLDNLDFGLSILNIMGYRWEERKPHIITSDLSQYDSVTVTGDTIRVIYKTYSFVYENAKGGLPGRYKTPVIGIVYRMEASSAFRMYFPADIEIPGLFDKKTKNRFVFRCGICSEINHMFLLRLGYAREPETISEENFGFKNRNRFSAGCGVLFTNIKFDFYISEDAFGLSGNYRF